MSDRKPLGKKLRFEVFKRDGFTCVYCGRQPPKVVLHCDHVVAVVNGGPDDIDNLVTACDACNLGKGGNPLTSVPLTIEEKAAVLREREEQIAAFNELVQAKRSRIEDTAQQIAVILVTSWGETRIRKDWFASIERFADALSLDDLQMAANRACSKLSYDPPACFAYFCGVCWNLIRGSR